MIKKDHTQIVAKFEKVKEMITKAIKESIKKLKSTNKEPKK